MKVLVTGTEGPVGVNLVELLILNGFSVRVLGDPHPGSPIPRAGQPEYFSGTASDIESLSAALDGIHAVFHCDNTGGIPMSRAGNVARRDFSVTRDLLISMSRCGTENLVYMGSAFVFNPGTEDEPGTEDHFLEAGAAKLTCTETARTTQDLVLRYNEAGRIRCFSVNPAMVIGKRSPLSTPFSSLVDYVAHGGRYYPPGGTSVVGAVDVAEGMLKALGRGTPGRCYILASRNMNYREMMSRLAMELEIDPPDREMESGQLRRMIGSLSSKITKHGPRFNREFTGFLSTDTYYSGKRAEIELGLDWHPVEEILAGACAETVSNPDLRPPAPA